MTYKSLESQIRSTMVEARKAAGQKAIDAWQKRINDKADKLEKSLPKKDVNEAKDAEGGMAKTQLLAIASKAKAMADSLKTDEQLEAWIQAKISSADDYIGTVHDVMMHDEDKGRVK